MVEHSKTYSAMRKGWAFPCASGYRHQVYCPIGARGKAGRMRGIRFDLYEKCCRPCPSLTPFTGPDHDSDRSVQAVKPNVLGEASQGVAAWYTRQPTQLEINGHVAYALRLAAYSAFHSS
jgi:hypothetical protein